MPDTSSSRAPSTHSTRSASQNPSTVLGRFAQNSVLERFASGFVMSGIVHLIIIAIGYIAKGSAIAAAGLLVILAAIRSQPNKASGLDGAFKTLGAQPYGVVLLIVAGLGIITYGLYSFAMTRYIKMWTPNLSAGEAPHWMDRRRETRGGQS